MRVKIEVGMSGPDYVRIPGEVVELEDGEAQRLIRAGHATPAAPVERAVEPPAEKRAEDKPPKAKKRKVRKG